MNRIQTITALAALSIFASFSSAAQAQLALQNGTFVSVSGSQTTGPGITSMYLGDSGLTSWSSNMPLSLTYGSVTMNVAFTGNAALFDGHTWAPSANNYLNVSTGGSAELSFSSVQNYFATRWMSQSAGDSLSFYNGDQLVASTTGASVKPLSVAATGSISSNVDFNFTEIGYDRVVVIANAPNFELGEITISENIQAAPIPLNAASLGGLMSFLMMLAMRGKGGTQVMVRMAFASLMPRRRAMA